MISLFGDDVFYFVDSARGSASSDIDKIFAKFDTDKSGEIEGEELENFMNELCKYLDKDLKNSGHNYDMRTINDWAKQWVDPNNDGKITLLEMKDNLKALLDSGE